MKAVKKLRKLAAFLLTVFLLTGEFYSAGFAVYAAGDAEEEAAAAEEQSFEEEDAQTEEAEEAAGEDEALTEDAEEAADPAEEEEEAATEADPLPEDEEISAEEEEPDGDPGLELANILVINGKNITANAGKYYGTDGVIYNSVLAMPNSVKGYLTFKRNDDEIILTMKDYELEGDADLTGLHYLHPDYDTNIYSNTKNLIIRVIGKCKIKPYGKAGADSYAIRTKGNLTIENTTKISGVRGPVAGTLTIEARSGSTVDWAGSICCDGDLNICGKLGMAVAMIDGYPLTLNCNSYAENGASSSIGEVASVNGDVTIDNADVYIGKGEDNGFDAALVAQKGSVTVNSSKLDITCGDSEDSATTVAGIWAEEDITVGSDARADIETQGGSKDVWAIYSNEGQISVSGHVEAGTFESERGAAIYAGGAEPGIILDGTYLDFPNTGYVESGTILYQEGKNTKTAYSVRIEKGEQYPLWIGNERVNSNNCTDLKYCFGGPDSRTASYDPVSGTLTLDGVTSVNYEYASSYGPVKIYSERSLKIRGNGDIYGVGTNSIAVLVDTPKPNGMLDIEGKFEFSGGGYAIYTGERTTVRVGGSDTELKLRSANKSAIAARNGFILDEGTVDAEGKDYGVYTDRGPIRLNYGKLSAKGDEAALIAYGADAIILGESMEIRDPAGAGTGLAKTSTNLTVTVIKNGEETVKEATLESSVHGLAVTQADGEYSKVSLEDPVYTEETGASYTVSYSGTQDDGTAFEATEDMPKPKYPGSYRVTVEGVKGDERWLGSADFVIRPGEYSARVDAVNREYDPDSKLVELENGVFVGLPVQSDDVRVDLTNAIGEMADENVGEDKAVTVSGVSFAGADAWKYKLREQPQDITVTITKAEWKSTSIRSDVEAGQAGELSLTGYLAPGAAAVIAELSFEKGEDQLDGAIQLSGTDLKWKIKADAEKPIVVCKLPVKNAANYQDYELLITLAPHEYTVSFEMNGHGEQLADQKVYTGEALEEPAKPASAGFAFKGWFADAELTTAYDFTKPVTADLILYAKWVEQTEGVSPLDPVPFIDADTTELFLVKGQKFTMKETGWAPKAKADKAIVSISRKGAFKAKKDGTATIVKDGREITITVYKPVIAKKLKLETGKEPQQIELKDFGTLNVLWYSANPDVARVDQSGKVTPVAKGSTKVTAYINGSAYNCTVTVTEPTPALTRTMHLALGASRSISIKGLKKPAWKPSKDDMVRIKGSKVTGDKKGSLELKAEGNDPEYRVTVFVEDLTLGGTGITADKGKNKYKLEMDLNTELKTAQITTDASLHQALIFKSSKPQTVFVDESGKITARAAGKAKLTAKVDGKTITISVVVK